MQIVGVGGRAKSGKTTLCKHIAKILVEENYGLPRILSFAGPLKEGAAIMGAEKETRPELYRKICQVVGTDIIRESDPDHWCKLMHIQLLKAERDEQNGLGKRGEIFVLIDDIRFMNEMACLKQWGANLVFLDADGRLTDLDEEWRKHASEFLATDYSNGKYADSLFNFVMTNNKAIDEFYLEVEKNMDLFLGGNAHYEAGKF